MSTPTSHPRFLCKPKKQLMVMCSAGVFVGAKGDALLRRLASLLFTAAVSENKQQPKFQWLQGATADTDKFAHFAHHPTINFLMNFTLTGEAAPNSSRHGSRENPERKHFSVS